MACVSSGSSLLEPSSIDNKAGLTGPKHANTSIYNWIAYKNAQVPEFNLAGPLLKLRVTGLSETGSVDGAIGPSLIGPHQKLV